MKRKKLLSLVALVFALTVPAQKPAIIPLPTGTVTGHVTCGDTQRPARYASVNLMPKPKPVTAKGLSGKADAAESETESLFMVEVTTGIDGSFTAEHVPPGDYIVIAHLAGYVVPLAVDEEAKTSGVPTRQADANVVLANFPVVHVVADHSVTVNAVLARGGVISGRVLFDDGGPIIGQWVEVSNAEGEDPFRQYIQLPGMSDIMNWQRSISTDDEGRYRFSGLPPGKYIISTQIRPEADRRTVGTSQRWHAQGNYIRQLFHVYAPGGFRKSEAKAIEVKGSEQQTDIDIRVNLSATHTVSGKVLSALDQHPLSFAFLTLKDAKDEKDFSRFTPLQSDGSYHFVDVPEGTYEVSVAMGADSEPQDRNAPASYVDAKVSLIVTDRDVTMDDFLLQPAKKDEKKP